MKKIVGIVSAAALIGSFSVAKEIKVGAILPMTGPLAAYGQNIYSGVKLASELQPKLKNGDTVKLILVDNKGDKAETASAATRLLTSENVVGILGSATSTNTGQIIALADEKKSSSYLSNCNS